MTNAIVTVQGEPPHCRPCWGKAPRASPPVARFARGSWCSPRRQPKCPEPRRFTNKAWSMGIRSSRSNAPSRIHAAAQVAAGTAQHALVCSCGRRISRTPEVARQILDAYGEERGQGRHLYRFPVVFPADHWQSVMPHELAAWGMHEKRFWSQYSADGRVRHCMCHAPIPMDHTGRRTIHASSAGARPCCARRTVGSAIPSPARNTSCASAT